METSVSAPKRVVIVGGGLAGLAAAKRLGAAGHTAIVLEKRDVLGGKWSSWQDEDGDWIETGLHVFFGAYEEIFDLMRDIGTYDQILWKEHVLTYTLDQGERFEFRTIKLPSPLHLLPAVFTNHYFSMGEKATLVKALAPILFGGENYYADQDRLTYQQWHQGMGIADRMLSKMFLPMTLALKFLKPEDISARVVLDVSGLFLRQNDASRMGFLRGAPEQYLTGPLARHIIDQGSHVATGARVTEILTGADGTVTSVLVAWDAPRTTLLPGETLLTPTTSRLEADHYITALPIHNLKRLLPASWLDYDYFRGLTQFEGVPVITVHLWADRQISNVDNILFGPDGIIPVYADMGNTTPDYAYQGKSRFQFVVAPAHDLMSLSDEEIVRRVWDDVHAVFPSSAAGARIEKSKVVRVPQSVYWPKPGMDHLRPSQASPVGNVAVAGGYTYQRFYDSMEGAVRSGNRAADAVLARIQGATFVPRA
jgi:15-cis-phytoene desaturase